MTTELSITLSLLSIVAMFTLLVLINNKLHTVRVARDIAASKAVARETRTVYQACHYEPATHNYTMYVVISICTTAQFVVPALF